jgi:hypothetical protein
MSSVKEKLRHQSKIAGLIKRIKAQDYTLPGTINRGRRLAGTSFAHHPRTEKQGI